jgi:hypothetical protein
MRSTAAQAGPCKRFFPHAVVGPICIKEWADAENKEIPLAYRLVQMGCYFWRTKVVSGGIEAKKALRLMKNQPRKIAG